MHIGTELFLRRHLAQHLARLGLLPLAQQKAYRLRQLPQNDGQQHQRYGSGPEHGLPAKSRQHVDAQAGAQHAAQRVAAEHDGHQGAPSTLGRILIHQRHGIGHQAAAAQARDEAKNAKLGGCRGKAAQKGRDAEEHEADGHALLAANAVRQWAKYESAKHHAEQRIATQRAGLHRGQPPFPHQHRQHCAIDEQVIPVKHQQQGTQERHHPVKSGEAGVVNDLVDFNCLHVGLLLFFYVWTESLSPVYLVWPAGSTATALISTM
ncbi:hypothetical protein D3C72_1374410 [compost metagenome]